MNKQYNEKESILAANNVKQLNQILLNTKSTDLQLTIVSRIKN